MVPNVIPGATGYWPLCQDRLSMLLEEREMSINSFLMMLPFEESCFCPIACGLVYGMVYMDFMEGLVSLAWGRYLKRFFRGANRV